MYDALPPLLGLLAVVAGVGEGPEPEDVKAGWGAFGIFLLLVAAVVLLAFSLVKQLRRAQSAKDAGVYGDEVATADEPGSPAGAEGVTPGASELPGDAGPDTSPR